MSRRLTAAAVAGVAFALIANAAVPAFAQEAANNGAPVTFDLGIDVTQLPQDTAGAKKYFAALAPDTQRVILAACKTYLAHPMDAAMPQTLVFCKAIQ